jgi:hypothetical protein
MGNTNINDNNISVLYEENTPGEVNRKIESELVDSYPHLNLQMEIPKCTENEVCTTANTTPVLRLRGGGGEEVIEKQRAEETVGERFILTMELQF